MSRSVGADPAGVDSSVALVPRLDVAGLVHRPPTR